jgi:site-specific recombinase XerD
LVRAFFDYAIGDGIIETNPAMDIKVRQEGDTADGWTFLTPQEQQAIATCGEIPEADRLRILFAMYTGLRQSEQRCLLLADVKIDDSTGPHVIVRYGAPGQATKSNRIRRVPLIPEAVAVTRLWLELLPSYAPKNPLKLAFPTPRGHRRDRGKLYGFHDLRKKAGITRPVRWHDLRHTCASSLAAGWWGRVWRLEEVRDLLGHSSVDVTERYAHLATSMIQTAANQTRRPAPAPLRSNRDPRGANPAKARPMGRHSGAVGHRFESYGARREKNEPAAETQPDLQKLLCRSRVSLVVSCERGRDGGRRAGGARGTTCGRIGGPPAADEVDGPSARSRERACGAVA